MTNGDSQEDSPNLIDGTANLIEELQEQPIQCAGCDETAVMRSFILRDSKPYKMVVIKDCASCGIVDTTQEDYEALDYGVEIVCDFSSPEDCRGGEDCRSEDSRDEDFTRVSAKTDDSERDKELRIKENTRIKENPNLRRMVFINSNSTVCIYEGGELLLDFVSDTSCIDSVEGVLLRGECLFKMARGDDQQLCRIGERLERVIGGGDFRLVITDHSGYSRVCPFGKEYAEVQDNALEAFEEENIKYTKISPVES